MQVRLLGPLEVEGDDGRLLTVPGAKLRAVLTMLALDAGRVVATERLIDDLWQDDPPAGAANALQRLVSKLRKALGAADRVTMRPPGYVLAVDPHDVDVNRLQAITVSARAAAAGGDHEAALAHLRRAEALWRGPALADVASEDFARPHIVRLDELRSSLAEDRVELELAMGRDAQLVPELEARVADHPLRERSRAQLMLALYRAGRQVDALRAYQDGRRVLADELGLDPGPELQRLESAVLAHDPTLLVDVAPPAPAAPASSRRDNLKASLTPLIGRDHEVQELSDLLSEARLVTLVGPGGAGKTRLAVEVAGTTRDRWDGVFVIELEAVRHADQVVGAVAAALEVPESPDPPLHRIRRACADRRLLLVLDNCEHLIDAAASFADDVLSVCEDIHVLATSRESLRLPGEVVWPIPPLTGVDARDLFIRRATAVDPSFTADEATTALIRDICTRLDGLPLAIELAAARTRAFSVSQIAERLDDRFRLLTGGSRAAMARQQTLLAVVQWSYDLLFEDERHLFDRLSVFAGGCLIGDAEAICGTAPLERDDIADLLDALVQKSLVTVDRSSRKPRFRMLQTLAQYGRDRLIERGEADEVLSRLSAHYAQLCTKGRDAFQGRDQRAWHHAMQSDRDNVRTAFDWAIGAGDKDIALGMAADVALHRWVTGTAREGHRWLEAGFALPGPTRPDTRGWALLWRGFLGYLSGHTDSADAHFEEGIEILRAHAGPVFEAYAMSFQAQIAFEAGRPEQGAAIVAAALEVLRSAEDDPWVRAFRTWLHATLALRRDADPEAFEALLRTTISELREAGDEFMTAVCLDLVAEFDEATGAIDAAVVQRSEALEIVRDLRMARFEAALLARLGATAVLIGDHASAEHHLQMALSRASDLGAEPVRALALTALGDLRRRDARLDEAERAAGEAHDLYTTAAPRFSSSFSRATAPSDVDLGLAASASVLGFVAAAREDTTKAVEWHRESFRHAHSVDSPRAVAVALEGLADAAVRASEGGWAARLLGAADQLRAERDIAVTPSERDDADRTRVRAEVLLGPGFTREHARGRASSGRELVALGPRPTAGAEGSTT